MNGARDQPRDPSSFSPKHSSITLGMLFCHDIRADTSQVRGAKMPHAALCVCAGASARGKKAPSRVVVLCRRVLQIYAVSHQKEVK